MTETTQNWDGLTEALAAPTGANRISYDFSYADALEILRLIDTTPNVGKLALSIGEVKIKVERDGGEVEPRRAREQAVAAPAPVAAPVSAPVVQPAAAEKAVQAEPEGTVPVRSPIAGIFYRAPAPGEQPFVELGSQVEEDTVVGIIEVMKVMNNIRAGTCGVVTGFGAENEDLVQFDQALFYVDPEAKDTAS